MTNMIIKKIPLLISVISFLFCNTRLTFSATNLSRDTLFYHVMQSIIDTNRSCLEIKSELLTFLTQSSEIMESNPEIEKRIETKSFLLELYSLFLTEEFFSAEELKFIEDTLLDDFDNTLSTWYVDKSVAKDDNPKPLLSQTLVFKDEEIFDNNVIFLHLFPSRNDNGEELMVILPQNAEGLSFMLFDNKDVENTDSVFVSKRNAISIRKKTSTIGEILIFGQEVINTMLTHNRMYIAYNDSEYVPFDAEIAEEDQEYVGQLQVCILLLNKFQEQYKKVVTKKN